jgi:hypothetical protein
MSLLTNVYETWCDWAHHGYQETERRVASIREQAETVKLGLGSAEVTMEIPKIFADILHTIAELVHWLVENVVVQVPQVVEGALVSYRSEFVLMLIDVYSLCTSWNAGLQLVTAQLHVSSGPTIPSLRPDPNAPFRNHPLAQVHDVVDESVVKH